jgi:DNA-binding protein HU-beta
MPPARRSATNKPATRASKAAQGVRARAATTKQATRREVEQSISRFEKRLDDANDALKTLGTHLGRGAQGSYKEVTSALSALRREAAKTNKQALKDFDKLRSAVVQKVPAAASSNSGSKRSTSKASTGTSKASTGTSKASTGTSKASSGSSRNSARKTTSRSSAKGSSSSRKTTSRSTSSRARSTRKSS